VKRVLLETRDLFFRAKLQEVVTGVGGEVTRAAEACDLAVVELGSPAADSRVKELVGKGVPVLAFGSHVRAEVLRAAREAGAVAVPNSEVEARLKAQLERGGS
jgi:hypothetical protein